MGVGIAHVLGVSNFEVYIHDIDSKKRTNAPEKIKQSIERQLLKGKITPKECQDALKNIQCEDNLSSLGQCDLIIEAVTEDETVKKQIFKQLQPHLKQKTLLTSNTSSISITRLAAH
jgi:3-hydroxybutyryl-CoA dehydrogenase